MDINISRHSKTSFWQKIALVVFGVFVTFILIETGLRLGGFIILSAQEFRNRASLMRKGQYRILCLGESTTQNQYPHILEDVLNKRNIGIAFSVIDKGLAGSNTSKLLAELEFNLDKYRPDMVVTMMGINDWGQYIPQETVSDSKSVFFLNSFKTYKLMRLLGLHMMRRFKDPLFHKPDISTLQRKLFSPQIGSRQVSQEEPNTLTRGKSLKFKNAIERSPRNDGVYVGLGWRARDQGKFSDAERLFKKALELNPKNDRAYVGLGRCSRDQGKFAEAEELFRKAIGLNPRNQQAYIELGNCVRVQGKLSEAEELFKKAAELNPGNDGAYLGLGRCFRDQHKFADAEELFKKAVELNPHNDWAYYELGQQSRSQGRFCEAEDLFKKAIENNPRNYWVYNELGSCLFDLGKLSEAEEIFKKAIALNPDNDKAYGALGLLYEERGDLGAGRKYVKEAGDVRYLLITANNYRTLEAILRKRGIAYVCVQYPKRNIEPLKKIFQGNENGIIFVDNEKIFDDAVVREGYQSYFVDMFGGDFGHCTKKGNTLLAENIASVILKEVFGK